jgi:hypothetical protein
VPRGVAAHTPRGLGAQVLSARSYHVLTRVFWAPNGTRLLARWHFTGPKKLSNFRAQPLPLALLMNMHASKNYKSYVHK